MSSGREDRFGARDARAVAVFTKASYATEPTPSQKVNVLRIQLEATSITALL
jgi:hypothetical protein